jgi:uncharacterized protein YdeI (YjbR/CyaY-like superfamily)
MGARDPRVDTYIGTAAPFAQPILSHLREIVHAACPSAAETIKWRTPAFDHKGLLCGIAGFKNYCHFVLWKAPLLRQQGLDREVDASEQRFTSLDGLPPDRVFTKLIKAAASLNDAGVKMPRAKTAPKPPPKVPADFLGALKKHRKAFAAFSDFSPSHKREYVEWITEAKTDATRGRRIAQAVEWIGEGKPRNWKYR